MRTSRDEITKRILAAGTYSTDARSSKISPQARYSLAYTAARMWCEIVLRAEDMRVTGQIGHHEKTIAAVVEYLGPEIKPTLTQLQRERRTRNKLEYDGEIGFVTGTTADNLIQILDELEEAVIAWLKEKHPDLLPLV
jgi:hypothetical protein